MNLQKDIRVKPTSDYKLPEVFIVSSGRSGTTLLSSMMNATDQIFFPYESDFVARAYPFYGKGKKIENDDYPTLVKLFQMSSQPTAWNMTESLLIDSLEKYSPTTLPEVFSVICRAFHEQKCTSNILWGIKAPVLIASLNRIVNVCPDAKIVHLVRDGRDVYLSYRKIHESSPVKFGPKGVVQSALYWIDGLKRIEEFINQGNNQTVYELRYFDLMLRPETELKNLCEYLNIDYLSSMHEDFGNHAKNKSFTPENLRNSIHRNVKNGLDATNTRKYISLMTRFEKIQYEFIAAPYLLKYGYELEFFFLLSPVFSPLRNLIYFCARMFNNWRYTWRDKATYRISLGQ